MEQTSNSNNHTPIALTIAGSDSGGGAGIQADIKTFSALDVYGASVITAITAQNTCGVSAVQEIQTAVIKAQLKAVFDDLRINAVKIGMLSSTAVIRTVICELNHNHIPMVIDPVMIAKSGDALLRDDAVDHLRDHLLPMADILTPNLPEAARLVGSNLARDESDMEKQGNSLLQMGAKSVLMKGGHSNTEKCVDLFIRPNQSPLKLVSKRIHTKNTHGTGCTLSAAIAAGLAKRLTAENAVQQAHAYLNRAIMAADQLQIGQGHGPVHHFIEKWA